MMIQKERGIITEEEYEEKKQLLMEDFKQEAKADAKVFSEDWVDYHPKSRIIYILLGIFFIGMGFHNFYAGYYKRGGIQLFLTLISFYMFYIPLLITSFWALAEFLFVNHGANGMRFRGNRAAIWLCRLAGMVFLFFYARKYEVI